MFLAACVLIYRWIMKVLLSECQKCQLNKYRIKTVKGTGNRNANLMFLGLSPGNTENETGIPFNPKAAAGKMLTKLIHKILKMKRSDVWITNTVKCHTPSNRAPFAYEINACYPWFRKELKVVKPGVIVALGGVALSALVNRSNIKNNRGKFLMLPNTIPVLLNKSEFPSMRSVYVVATYHPAAVCYGSKEHRAEIKQAMIDDFKMLHKWYVQRTMPEVEVVKAAFLR